MLTRPYGKFKLRTQNSELRTQNSELRTQNSELRTQNSELRTQNSGRSLDLSGNIKAHSVRILRTGCAFWFLN